MVTGGAGFIGSALVRYIFEETNNSAVIFDKLTYAANLRSLESVEHSDRHEFVRGNICDPVSVQEMFRTREPDIIMHLAAESHVDRSIDGACEFIDTNVTGTFTLLEAAV